MRPMPIEALPIWRTTELHWFVRFFVGYLYPVMCPLASITHCPTVVDWSNTAEAEAAHLCMKKARDCAQGPDNLYDWKSFFDYEIIFIDRPEGGHPLRVTLLKKKNPQNKSKSPLILNIHGGGFTVRGGKEILATQMFTTLLKIDSEHSLQPALSSAVWAIVEYRLAPDHVWPAATNDCILALNHLVYQMELGEGGVHIQGFSAGGTLAMETTLKSLALVDTFFVDEPVVPLIDSGLDGRKTWSLDSQSLRRNAFTRMPPVTWLEWSLKSYTGMETVPANERNITLGSVSTTVDITGGSMTVSEWVKKSHKLRPLPNLLLVTAKGDPLHDGGVAFKNVFEQAIEEGTKNRKLDSTVGETPKVKYFDTTSGHGGYLMFEPSLFQNIMGEWYREIRSVWERKGRPTN